MIVIKIKKKAKKSETNWRKNQMTINKLPKLHFGNIFDISNRLNDIKKYT